jgi:Flp pilus assembly protein CpaB
MQRHRILVFFAVAWVSALVLSWWVYRKATAPAQREWVRVVAATRDVSIGRRLAAPDLKLVEVERKDLPQGAYTKISDVVDRAVVSPVMASELVLERKLAPKGGGEGLTALIEPGMRAVAVQVNDMSGVAGFVQPGTRVDVLFVRMLSNGDAASTTILQNVKVIAYGKQLEPGGKLDPRDVAIEDKVKLVAEHEIMGKEDVDKLLGQFKCTKDMLPKMFDTDPTVLAIKAKPGDVIRIKRKSPTACESMYYRVVVKHVAQ